MRPWLALICALGAAEPARAQSLKEYAPVLSSVPVVETVAVPRQVCSSELRCGTVNFYENRTVGYRVTYLYGEREYTVQLPYDPGPTVSLHSDAARLGEPGAPPPAVAVVPVPVPAPVVVVPPAVVHYGSVYYPWRPYPVYPSVGLHLRFGGGHGHHHRHHHRHHHHRHHR